MSGKIIFEDLTKSDDVKSSDGVESNDGLKKVKDDYTKEEIENLVKGLAGTLTSYATQLGFIRYMKVDEIILAVFTSAYDLSSLYSDGIGLLDKEEIDKIIEKAKSYSLEHFEKLKDSDKLNSLKEIFSNYKKIGGK